MRVNAPRTTATMRTHLSSSASVLLRTIANHPLDLGAVYAVAVGPCQDGPAHLPAALRRLGLQLPLAVHEPVQDDAADDPDRGEDGHRPQDVQPERDHHADVSRRDDIAVADRPQGLHHVIERIDGVQLREPDRHRGASDYHDGHVRDEHNQIPDARIHAAPQTRRRIKPDAAGPRYNPFPLPIYTPDCDMSYS